MRHFLVLQWCRRVVGSHAPRTVAVPTNQSAASTHVRRSTPTTCFVPSTTNVSWRTQSVMALVTVSTIAYYVLGEWLVSMLQGLRLQPVWWGAPKSHVLCFRRQTWAGKYYLRRALVTVSTVNSYVFGEWLWVVMCCMDCYVPLLMKVEKQ